MFLTPLITIPLALKYVKKRLVTKLIIGISLAVVSSAILYVVYMSIVFRNGLGPT